MANRSGHAYALPLAVGVTVCALRPQGGLPRGARVPVPSADPSPSWVAVAVPTRCHPQTPHS
eukprot:2407546-Alexandrium_andersonii.AAC.1